MNRKDWIFAILLVFVPISIAWNFLRWDVTIVFLSACLAIVPLAAYMGKATEEIAVVVGPNLGGLLNATFGNATELILAYAALEEGLIEVVKATITGSIIGNLLVDESRRGSDPPTHDRSIHLRRNRGERPTASLGNGGGGINFCVLPESAFFDEDPYLSLRGGGRRSRSRVGGSGKRKKAESLALGGDITAGDHRGGGRIGIIS